MQSLCMLIYKKIVSEMRNVIVQNSYNTIHMKLRIRKNLQAFYIKILQLIVWVFPLN